MTFFVSKNASVEITKVKRKRDKNRGVWNGQITDSEKVKGGAFLFFDDEPADGEALECSYSWRTYDT